MKNSFVISTARWGIFNHTINASVKTAEAITKATTCLHNFLRLTNCSLDCPNGFIDSEYITGFMKTVLNIATPIILISP